MASKFRAAGTTLFFIAIAPETVLGQQLLSRAQREDLVEAQSRQKGII
jgi:hypothetical protein